MNSRKDNTNPRTFATQMIIAINTKTFLNNYPAEELHFLQQLLIKTAAKYPLHPIILLGEKPFEKGLLLNENQTPVIAGKASGASLLRKYWYAIKIPALLKRHKASLFISLDGLCTLTASIPQCLFLSDPASGEIKKSGGKKSIFLTKGYTLKILNKANFIITTSATARKNILNVYPIPAAKIVALNPAIDSGHEPISYEEKELIKTTFTEGKNYFIYTGEINANTNWLTLLKAFSVFKKRQKTEWKLVLTAKHEINYTEFSRRIESYKYRSEVILLNTLKEKDRDLLLGSAYALLMPTTGNGFGLKILQAMQAGIPVIACGGGLIEERAANAALYADSDTHTDLADKMMLLYKDESLHRQLVENAGLRSRQFDWDKTVELFWNNIVEAAIKQETSRH